MNVRNIHFFIFIYCHPFYKLKKKTKTIFKLALFFFDMNESFGWGIKDKICTKRYHLKYTTLKQIVAQGNGFLLCYRPSYVKI